MKQSTDEGPVGTALGVLTGALSGEFAEEFARDLRTGDLAVLAEVDEDWTAPLDTRIGLLGGKVVREPREAFAEELMQKRIAADKATFEKLKTAVATKEAERMESALEHELQSTTDKLRRQAEKTQQRLDHGQEEMNAKVQRLAQQAAAAKPDVKNRIQQRIAALQKEYGERLMKLRRAYEMTQEALRA